MMPRFRPAQSARAFGEMVSGPVVPENVLKRRKRLEQIQAERQERLAEQRGKKRTVNAGVTFKKASAFVAEYRAVDKTVRRMKREYKKPTPVVDPESKLLLVVRMRGSDGADPKTRRILQMLRLRKVRPFAYDRLSAAYRVMSLKPFFVSNVAD